MSHGPNAKSFNCNSCCKFNTPLPLHNPFLVETPQRSNFVAFVNDLLININLLFFSFSVKHFATDEKILGIPGRLCAPFVSLSKQLLNNSK